MGLFSFSEDANQAVMEKFQKIMAEHGVVPIPELVRQVHGGNSSHWHQAAGEADSLVQGHDEAGDRGMQMLQGLESSWTGEGADAASGRIRAGVKASQVSSEVYGANARQYADGAYAFENLKSQLTPMENQAPERSAWDSLTPWDTDTEDQVNRYNAQLEQNRQAYQSYEQTMKSSQSGVRTDFGDVSSLGGGFGDVTIGKDGAGKNGTDHSSGVITFDESSSGPRNSPPGGSAVPPVGGPGSVNGPSPGDGPSSYTSNLPGPSTGDDSTSTSGYTPPGVTSPAASTSNYQPPGFNPSTGFGPNSGGGTGSTTGFGPGATSVGFGPTSGSTGTGTGGGGRFSGSLGGGTGSGSGGAGSAGGRLTGGGAGAVGAGKGTGAGPLGAAGSGSAGAAGTSAGGAGAAGRGGMGAMGGAGAGRGKGSDDEEHQRRFVQNDDEAFALTEDGEVLRDPETGNVITPPTIGG